ncbi:MAG: gliding motility-associated C-terminal domain-containing protein [Salibacteraceae bacterium]
MKNFFISTLFISLINISYSQCNSNPLNLGPDTTTCSGDYHVFNAGPGYLSYNWSNGSNSQFNSVNQAGVYICSVDVAGTTNLVNNGNFSNGNNGFTSSYVYGTGGTWGLLSNPGQYAISTNANLTHNNFPSCNDHTSGTGNFMIMNGSSVANTNVWCQTITVAPNTKYSFSGWFTSVDPASPAQLNLTVDGNAIGTAFTLSSTTCNWTKYERTWTSGATQTSANICIRSQSTAGGGNDFAVDDIIFTTVCTFSDTVVLALDTMPIANIGPDTVICTGGTYPIDATDNASFSYQWSNGSTIPVSTITSTDSNLMITVTNGKCAAMDTAIITFSSHPLVNLGNDTTLCPGDSLVLEPSWPNANYLWSDNSTNSSLTITNSGLFWVQISDNCGVTRDSVTVNYVTYPLVQLGNDTNICDGNNLVLNASHPNASYLWNTGGTDSVITVNQTGQYSVNVKVGSCIDKDTISVTVDPFPIVDLGTDTILCAGQTHVLQANNQNASYLWNDGSIGAAKFVNSPGLFWVKVSIGNCENSDSILVTYLDYPTVELGSDSFACGNTPVIYDVGQPNVSYLWNDGSTDSSLSITQTTQVWVEISNFCGVVSDTVNVYVNPYPIVDLGSDTSICEGETFTKDVFYLGATYEWSDGSNLNVFDFNSSGTYYVTVTANRCETIDSLNLVVDLNPIVDLGPDSVVCNKSNFTLLVPNDFDSIGWFNGSSELSLLVVESGAQWVEVKSGNCIGSDTVWIGMENCETHAEMPNIFTPNDDGINDLFTPVYIVGISEMRTQIFDRWGKVVYETNDLEINWNGKNKNEELVSDGTYYWVINIIGLDAEKFQQTGTVTLVRD